MRNALYCRAVEQSKLGWAAALLSFSGPFFFFFCFRLELPNPTYCPFKSTIKHYQPARPSQALGGGSQREGRDPWDGMEWDSSGWVVARRCGGAGRAPRGCLGCSDSVACLCLPCLCVCALVACRWWCGRGGGLGYEVRRDCAYMSSVGGRREGVGACLSVSCSFVSARKGLAWPCWPK